MYKVATLPAWEDNYVFIIHNETNAIIVDPTSFEVADAFIEENQLQANSILTTHHHPDHIGGIEQLVKKYDIPVFCSEYDKNRVPCANRLLNPGDNIEILNLRFEVLDLSGHTLGLIGYYCKELEAVFSGDCIFSLGCGYLFEGTPEQMQKSLEKISSLPENTKIYCSHEYTLNNAKFQETVEYKDGFHEMLATLKRKRQQAEFTIPSTVEFEKKWNVFLRWDDEKLKKHNGISELSKAEYVAHMRTAKNNF